MGGGEHIYTIYIVKYVFNTLFDFCANPYASPEAKLALAGRSEAKGENGEKNANIKRENKAKQSYFLNKKHSKAVPCKAQARAHFVHVQTA